MTVRVGGGWESLRDFLAKHDACRTNQKLRRYKEHWDRRMAAADATVAGPFLLVPLGSTALLHEMFIVLLILLGCLF